MTRAARAAVRSKTIRWVLASIVPTLACVCPSAVADDLWGLPNWTEAAEMLKEATDTVDVKTKELVAVAGDRKALVAGVADLLFWELDFQNGRAARWNDPNTVGWLVLTDDLSDTIATRLHPILGDYNRLNPDEILTEGRQAFELAHTNLVPPATRMLGFHITRMGRFTYARAESLVNQVGVTDVAGIEDGFLRLLWDWLQQYQQFHTDVVQKHMSRVTQEDWVIARLKPLCPEGKRYRIVGQYMAMATESRMYSHRFQLVSDECSGSQVTIEVPLPHFAEYMEEVNRLSIEQQRQLLQEKMKYR